MLAKVGTAIAVGAISAALIAGTDSVELTGVVSDNAGAVIPDAKVILHTHGSKEVSAFSRTDQFGIFAFKNLKKQSFDLYVQVPGFRQALIPNVDATVNDKIKVPPVKLEIGDPICILEVHPATSKSGRREPGH